MIGQQISLLHPQLQAMLTQQVKLALQEDIQDGDLTAALIDKHAISSATIVSREKFCLCGSSWLNEVFKTLDSAIEITWLAKDGDILEANTVFCKITGNSQALLTGERTALNFLQTLSATATTVYQLVQKLQAKATLQGQTLHTKLLDTRKTLPMLRLAQKYAVAIGGGYNHRLGLYDAFLIKENHIAASGSIAQVIAKAKQFNKPIEIEVENLAEFTQALNAGADVIMLDNFNNALIEQAMQLNKAHTKPALLEVSGNMQDERILELSHLGVDFISCGALTKHVRAIDLSMRII